MDDNEIKTVIINFAKDNAPIIKEWGGKDYIMFGEKNDYPEFLISLFNHSAKHNALVCGKVNYIYGKGLGKEKTEGQCLVDYKDVAGNKIKALPVNSAGETLNEIIFKSILDTRIHGGFRWLVTWLKNGSFEISHVEYQKIRTGRERGVFYYKDKWDVYTKKYAQPIEYPEFNPNNKTGTQVFAYNEYRPGTDKYPLPDYIGAINYIQADVAVGDHTYGNAEGGFTASKHITFFKGDPGEEGARRIERKFSEKFTGRKGQKFVLAFVDQAGKKPEIDDLGASDLTKEDFTAIDNLIQQNIYAGHQITSPMLFGIKTEGQLGGATELNLAYTIFNNTYADPKRQDIERIVNYFAELMGQGNDYYIQPLDPIGLQMDVKDVINALPKSFVFEYFNIPKEKWDEPNIGADNRPTPTVPVQVPDGGQVPTGQAQAAAVNSVLTNLTAKQHQQVLRIVRDFTKGRLTQAQAVYNLVSGYGFTEGDAKNYLGIEDPEQFAQQYSDDEVIGMFEAVGEFKADYEIIRAKKVAFSYVEEAEADENEWALQFKDITVTNTDQSILNLIKKDKLVTPEVIATALHTSKSYIVNRLKILQKRGLIDVNETTVGEDTQVERTVQQLPDNIKTTGGGGTGAGLQISVKYSYEGPRDSRNRPFCAKMLELDRLYTRSEIETISQKLGYSVFDRRGGFWRHKDGTTTPYCRHHWKSNIVVKKTGTK